MTRLRKFIRRINLLLGRRAFERDLDDELRFHVEMQTAKNVQRGMSPDAARALAEREFGRVERYKDEVRDVRGATWIDDLGRDARFSIRALGRSPGFVAVAVLCLALGIGANAAIFSVIDAVLLRPLPYPQADRIVRIYETMPLRGPNWTGSVSWPNYTDWAEQSTRFERIAAYSQGSLNLRGTETSERIAVVAATPNVFQLLGVGPRLGRGFVPSEGVAGSDNVAVLSDEFWRVRFGGDAGIVGRSISLDGEPYTVIGVMPPGFAFPANAETQAWVPLVPSDGQTQNRGSHAFNVIARLAPGATHEQADRQIQEIAARIEDEFPDTQTGRSASAIPMRDSLVDGVRPALLVLLGAVGLVLLIACANVANLLLARAATRRHEVAIRLALGAGRARIVRQFLVESVLLALGGAVLGAAFAWWSLDALTALAARAVPFASDIQLDLRVFAFLLLVAVVSGLGFGLFPALQLTRSDVRQTLADAGAKATASGSQQRFRSTLVVAEIAFSLVLLVGAGLLIRAFVALRATDSGLVTENVLTVHLAIPGSKYDGVPAAQQTLQPILDRIRELPGVTAAGLTTILPIQRWGMNGPFSIDGEPAFEPGQEPNAELRLVSPGVFAALGVPLRQGRLFTETEAPDGRTILVNETLARNFIQGDAPIGRQIRRGPTNTFTIVGVVADVRQAGLDRDPQPEIYLPYTDSLTGWLPSEVTVAIKTAMPPGALAEPVRQAVRSVAPDVPVFNVQTMDEVVGTSLAQRRLNLSLLTIFAGIALVLAAAGLYGVISYLVTQRTREMGIRLALGAQASDVMRLVMRQGAGLAAAGIAVGVVTALVFSRFVESLLYGVSARDPLTFAIFAVLLGIVALLATYLPARRATRVDPLRAIRSE